MKTSTIYASFETVDLAELAARKVKRHFPEIQSIAIRYRNNPKSEPPCENDHEPRTENSAFLTAAAMGNGMGSSFGVAPIYAPLGMTAFDDGDRYTKEDSPLASTESRIVIKADQQYVNAIEAQLFNLGGTSVHASLRP